ncbi:hypothetical protein WR25_14082 [Diploscapter pachys]|uniref:Uncharacterized protein n=1 Tax=Diploscapter pachys TaxID=2018661 RepID=A0A2A2KT79_9BILA|nr:hypothetical protein WR25_14082 [Diploscapter pachys]
MIMDPSTELLQLDGNNGNTVSYANLQLIPQSYQGTYNIPVTLNAYPLNIPIQTVSYSAYSTTLYPQESTVNVIQVSEPIFTASYEPKYDDLAKSPSSSM